MKSIIGLIVKEELLIDKDILVVMHPKEYPERLCTMLSSYNLTVTLVQNVQSAYEQLKLHIAAFILLDLDIDGAVPFLKNVLTSFNDPPPYILAVDSFPDSMAQVEMLNLGADVCLEKPLDIEEVLAVINAALRRADRLAYPKLIQPTQHIDCGALSIDIPRRNVNIDGKSVALTVKEFDILRFLASYPDVVFSREQIYERVWNDDYKYATTSVSDHISSLRKKLGLSARDGRYIQTVYGAGYRFVEPR